MTEQNGVNRWPEYENGETVNDWTQLLGRQVAIRSTGRFVDGGQVEAVTADGSILWLALEGANPRRLVEKQSQMEVRLIHSSL